ncbi:class D sortase [Bacillus sp. 179-C3.3 HS]|uniref:class D sortase n=1 Tax=Bacillus sp. 179-C3.3 HS TaxID=3232162 RepID=UPI0039A2CA97
MKKWLALFVMISGVVLVGWGIWQIASTHFQTAQSLEDARKVVAVKQGMSKRQFAPKMGEASGILTIPRLKADLPIVEGTDADDLAKGVGHYKGSYYPDQHGQIVLSGHRDTVFRRTGELEIGDQLHITVPYGEFRYEITHTKIVDQHDTSIITLQNEKEELVLTTCYPFHFVGHAPERYIIYAKRTSA